MAKTSMEDNTESLRRNLLIARQYIPQSDLIFRQVAAEDYTEFLHELIDNANPSFANFALARRQPIKFQTNPCGLSDVVDADPGLVAQCDQAAPDVAPDENHLSLGGVGFYFVNYLKRMVRGARKSRNSPLHHVADYWISRQGRGMIAPCGLNHGQTLWLGEEYYGARGHANTNIPETAVMIATSDQEIMPSDPSKFSLGEVHSLVCIMVPLARRPPVQALVITVGPEDLLRLTGAVYSPPDTIIFSASPRYDLEECRSSDKSWNSTMSLILRAIAIFCGSPIAPILKMGSRTADPALSAGQTPPRVYLAISGLPIPGLTASELAASALAASELAASALAASELAASALDLTIRGAQREKSSSSDNDSSSDKSSHSVGFPSEHDEDATFPGGETAVESGPKMETVSEDQEK